MTTTKRIIHVSLLPFLWPLTVVPYVLILFVHGLGEAEKSRRERIIPLWSAYLGLSALSLYWLVISIAVMVVLI